jgi:hypothetical protein
MEGLTLTASWGPKAAATEAKTGYGLNYTGVEGLSVKYASADVIKVTLLLQMVTLQC